VGVGISKLIGFVLYFHDNVEIEKQFMQLVDATQKLNVSDQKLLSDIHVAFYANLSHEHLYTHTQIGFTEVSVKPGEFRNVNV